MGWFSIYRALKENGDVKAALRTNDYGQAGRAFDVAAEKIVYEELPMDKPTRAKITYWFRRFGHKNPYKQHRHLNQCACRFGVVCSLHTDLSKQS